NVVRIDWVEIPAGEYLTGISEQQREMLRSRVRQQMGFDRLPGPTQLLIEQACNKFRASARPVRYTPEEQAAIRNPTGKAIHQVKPDVYWIRPRATAWLGTYYIARFPTTILELAQFPGSHSHVRDYFRKAKYPESHCPQFSTFSEAKDYCNWA